MPRSTPFTTRPLSGDDAEALAMALQANAHDIYITNTLAQSKCENFVYSHNKHEPMLG